MYDIPSKQIWKRFNNAPIHHSCDQFRLFTDEDYNVHPIFRRLNENERRKLYLAACILPYKDVVYAEKKKDHPACRFVIREGVKV